MIFFSFYPYRKKASAINYVRSRAGFSLIEILIVISIIGILSTIALPAYFAGMPHRRLKSASRDIYGVMQQARLKAVRENWDTTLIFGTDFYYIDEDSDGVHDSDEKRIDLSRYTDVQFVSGAVSSVGIGAESTTPSTSVTFTSTGTATFTNNENAVYIENVTNPQEVFSVAVMGSGAIKISWYDGNEWK